MQCPYCGQNDSRVVDTRETATGIRRRRECLACQQRFTTYESVAVHTLQVVKRDGRREDYDREKLLSGVRKACTKRPIPSEAVLNLVNQVEAALLESGRLEVSSERIGQLVMEKLRDLDHVAYIRFASVYLPFADLASLRSEIDGLLE
jgi:transcriptional repressor NrdR